MNCPACGRKIPEDDADAPTRPKKKRFTVLEPPSEEGLLDHLLEDIVSKYQEVWPDLLAPVTTQGWRYKATAFAFQAVIDANLIPSEVGK